MNINYYLKLIKDFRRMENNRGISARINPKGKKTKKKGRNY